MVKLLANKAYNFLNENAATNTVEKHVQFESTVSPGKRDLIFQREFTTLDPIFRYYRLGADENLSTLVLETVQTPNTPPSEQIGINPQGQLGDLNALSAEPPGSVNMWWGYGAWEGSPGQPSLWNEELPSLTTAHERRWRESSQREGGLYPAEGLNQSPIDEFTLNFRGAFPTPFGSGENFYMADALSNLAESAMVTDEVIGELVPDSTLELVPYVDEVLQELTVENLPDTNEVRGLIQQFTVECSRVVSSLPPVYRGEELTTAVERDVNMHLNELQEIQTRLLEVGASQTQIDNTRDFYFSLMSGGQVREGGRRPRGQRIPLSEAYAGNVRVQYNANRGSNPPTSWTGIYAAEEIPQSNTRGEGAALADPALTPEQVDGRDIPRKHTLGYFFRTEYRVILTGQGYQPSIFHESRGPFARNQELRRRFGQNNRILRTRSVLQINGIVAQALAALGLEENAFRRTAENLDPSFGVQEQPGINPGDQTPIAPNKTALDVLNFIFAPGPLNRSESPGENFTKAAFKLPFADQGTRLNASLASFVEYQFYDFKSETSFVRDPVSNSVATSAGAQGAGFDDTILAGAFIRPEYNYFNKRYEQAIADASVSEIILPNMYMYSLVAASPDLGLESPRWDSSLYARQTQDDYDRLITLGEFSAEILPSLESGDQEYLDQYAAALEGKNFSLTLTSPEYQRVGQPRGQTVDDGESRGAFGESVLELLDEGEKTLLEKYYNVDTPASEISLYESINNQKIRFPMYIELGIPTIKIGENVRAIQSLIPTDQITHSILTTDPEEQQNFNCATTIVVKDEDTETPLLQSLLSAGQVLNVYDFEEWISNCRERAAQGDAGSHGSLTLFRDDEVTQRFQHGNDALLLGLRTLILQNAKEKVLPYQNLLLGQPRDPNQQNIDDPVRLADSETVMYKLAKKDADGNIIQNFFFPNTDENFINYVDTQVKYNKEYTYDLHAYDVIFGTKYRFRHRESAMGIVGDEENGYRGAYASFNVESLPCVKIAEYRVNSDMWLTEALNPPQGEQGGLTPEVGGISYPPVSVQDFPPVPPSVRILPYRGVNDKVVIALTPGIGDRTGKNSSMYYALTDTEEQELDTKRLYQKNTRNFNLPPRHLEFKGEGDDVKMEIYRITDIPVVGNLEQLYKVFGDNGPHRVLSLSPENLDEEAVVAFDVLENIEPNVRYYYTFRSIDRHNAYSNPSQIYSVQLVSRDDFTYPEIGLFKPVFDTPRKDTKKAARYVEISAADIQSQPFEDIFTRESEALEPVRSLVRGIEQESFLVRFTSRDTGRKFDVKLSFNVSEKTISVTEND